MIGQFCCRWLRPEDHKANADRHLLSPGQIHSVFTPLVAEFQALWGVEYLRGNVALPSLEAMTSEVAVWNAWTRKRYLEQGRCQHPR